nr:ribosome biogenesis GTPase YlqF [Maliibacterium massiliense]
MQIQWYPGHMTKARRMLQENLKLVDLVILLLDARMPRASLNPDIETMMRDKRRIVVLNKADLADPAGTAKWRAHFQAQGARVLELTSTQKKARQGVLKTIEQAVSDRVAAMKARGVNKIVRAMVVGIPNVGKSTFINMLTGASVARAADKPGVTRGKQWIRVAPHLELLDTPGLLWPKFEDAALAHHLAFCGAIRDEIIDQSELCAELLETLAAGWPQLLMQRYKLETLEGSGAALLEEICRKRGFLLKGGALDIDRGAHIVLDEFRGGKMGGITLELPED